MFNTTQTIKVPTFLLFIFSIILFSCKDTRSLTYFQDLSDTAVLQKVRMYPYKPLKIQPDDQLQVTISSNSPEASQFYNRGSSTAAATVAGVVATPNAGLINLYSVSSKGNITLPVLGDIPVAGLTIDEIQQKILKILRDGSHLKEPIVSASLTNFRVTVIGEVGHPMVIPVNGEGINVIEAVSATGDMTSYGKRFNVKVMRRNKDVVEVANLNFNNTKVFQSPYFQLQQNDVVYIEPNKYREASSKVVSPYITIGLGVVGVILSVISIIVR